MPYQDGTFTSAVQNGPKQIFYPFLNSPTKDSTTKGTIRTMVSLPNYYATLAALSTDPDDATQYLIEETEPSIDSAIARWQRTYCKVPGDQVIYGSRVITKPNPSTLGIAGSVLLDYTGGVSPANRGNIVQYVNKLWANNQVYNYNSTSSSVTVPTSGTFTLTYKTSTSAAINYNETSANIQTTLNALAAVVADGVTFSVTTYLTLNGIIVLSVTAGTTTSPVIMNAGSLNPAASRTAFTPVSGLSQTIYIGARATVIAHGFNTSNNLFLFESSGVGRLLPSTLWQSVDSDTISFCAFGTFNSSVVSAGQFLRNYTPGTDRVGTKNTQKFYLPGVTVGITTAADIPIPSTLLNDADFLASVVANTSGYQTYDANELTTWRGPIYTQTLTDINMADV